MTEFHVSLKSVSDVKQFVSTASLEPVDIDVVSGRYTVDAKSILGLCSLDLDKPVLVKVYGSPENGADFREKVKNLTVPEPEE